MPSVEPILKIDFPAVVKRIEGDIQENVLKHSTRGVLIGLSGGIDSAVLSTLAVRALGKEKVYLSFLYDRTTEKESKRKALLIAHWLGVKLESKNIDPAISEMGVYKPLVMRLDVLSNSVSRYLINNLYRWLLQESPFVSTLRRGNFGRNKLKELIFNSTVRHIEASFNARHIYRRRVLEKKAKEENLLLLGATNRSEWEVGWFVKGGIDDLPHSPLIGLYKTQIKQLAAYLGIPSEVKNQIPSPDMMRGVTDEFALGISYNKIDIILDGLDHNLSEAEIIVRGVKKKEISLIREMNRLSAWKRGAQHSERPVADRGNGGWRNSDITFPK